MQIGKKSESAIEGRLRDRVKLLGGRCLKFVSPGQNGVPDRIILLPGGRVVFAELKAPGKRERKLQLYVQGFIRDLGFTVIPAVDSYDRVEYVIEKCKEVMGYEESIYAP